MTPLSSYFSFFRVDWAEGAVSLNYLTFAALALFSVGIISGNRKFQIGKHTIVPVYPLTRYNPAFLN